MPSTPTQVLSFSLNFKSFGKLRRAMGKICSSEASNKPKRTKRTKRNLKNLVNKVKKGRCAAGLIGKANGPNSKKIRRMRSGRRTKKVSPGDSICARLISVEKRTAAEKRNEALSILHEGRALKTTADPQEKEQREHLLGHRLPGSLPYAQLYLASLLSQT